MSVADTDYAAEGARLVAADPVASRLCVAVRELRPGLAVLAMPVRADMLNFWGVCHGGIISTFADVACSLACNAGGELTVGSALQIDYLAPAREGDTLTALATEVSVAGRTVIYDVSVDNQDGVQVAIMRGRCRRQVGRESLPAER